MQTLRQYKGHQYDAKDVLRTLRDRLRQQCGLLPTTRDPSTLEEAALFSICYRVEHNETPDLVGRVTWWVWRMRIMHMDGELPPFILEPYVSERPFDTGAIEFFRHIDSQPHEIEPYPDKGSYGLSANL